MSILSSRFTGVLFRSSERAASRTTVPAAVRTPAAIAQTDKINRFFAGIKAADNKKSEPVSTVQFVQARLQVDQKKAEIVTARKADKPAKRQISQLTRELKVLKHDVQKHYVTGPLGETPASLAKRRKEQKKPAMIDGLHTIFGARVWNAASGLAGPEIASTAARAGLHQGIGYAPQSFLSGALRIVTEVIQQRMNKAGKPKMASNMAIASNFKLVRREIEAAAATLQAASNNLEKVLEDSRFGLSRTRPWKSPSYDGSVSPRDHALRNIAKAREDVDAALATLKAFDTEYENLCIVLERECRGKRGSAVVSMLAGIASLGAYAVEPTGAGAIAGHRLLSLAGVFLQGPASYFDYLDSTIDYPQKITAKRIDLDLLIKAGSRTKSREELTEEDIDVTIASKLYDEQPKLMHQTIRAIYTRECADLTGEILRLKEAGPKRSAADTKKLEKQEQTLAELHAQIVLFEQHRGDALNPDGLIGRCILDATYFCRKGIATNLFGKAGEFWAQANQRFANNFNPLFGLGLFSLAFDAVALSGESFQMGLGQLHDGGQVDAHNAPHLQPTSEAATATLIATGIVASVNSGVTVGPSRFNKTVHDRVALATPAWLAKGLHIAPQSVKKNPLVKEEGVAAMPSGNLPQARLILKARRTQLAQARQMNVISASKAKRLEAAADILEEEYHLQNIYRDAPGKRAPRTAERDTELTRMEARWQRFDVLKQKINSTTDAVNRDWKVALKDAHGQPVTGHDGKQIEIDMRASVACQRVHMPRLERWMTPIRGVPRSIVQSMTFWKDVIKAKQTRDALAPYVTPPHYRKQHPQAHPESESLARLMADSAAVLERYGR